MEAMMFRHSISLEIIDIAGYRLLAFLALCSVRNEAHLFLARFLTANYTTSEPSEKIAGAKTTGAWSRETGKPRIHRKYNRGLHWSIYITSDTSNK